MVQIKYDQQLYRTNSRRLVCAMQQKPMFSEPTNIALFIYSFFPNNQCGWLETASKIFKIYYSTVFSTYVTKCQGLWKSTFYCIWSLPLVEMSIAANSYTQTGPQKLRDTRDTKILKKGYVGRWGSCDYDPMSFVFMFLIIDTDRF